MLLKKDVCLEVSVTWQRERLVVAAVLQLGYVCVKGLPKLEPYSAGLYSVEYVLTGEAAVTLASALAPFLESAMRASSLRPADLDGNSIEKK